MSKTFAYAAHVSKQPRICSGLSRDRRCPGPHSPPTAQPAKPKSAATVLRRVYLFDAYLFNARFTSAKLTAFEPVMNPGNHCGRQRVMHDDPNSDRVATTENCGHGWQSLGYELTRNASA
ncbi:hypothetical protein OPT61_g5957 [Boeremia exigua]|uniref:Uncharacterized protein n=1 Tax=Boeremia exigua TaxID=749465 RepID=A0ACC2I8P7_9PLEO|nr:hypothetical protein OPT61_g5957 [Boeremia exigua]